MAGWLTPVPPFDHCFTLEFLPIYFVLTLLEIILNKLPQREMFENIFFLLRPPLSILAIVSVTQVFPNLTGNLLVAIFLSLFITIPIHIDKVRSRIISRAKIYHSFNIISSIAEDALAILGGILAFLVKYLAFPLLLVSYYFVFEQLRESKLALVEHHSTLEEEKPKGPRIKIIRKLRKLKKIH